MGASGRAERDQMSDIGEAHSCEWASSDLSTLFASLTDGSAVVCTNPRAGAVGLFFNAYAQTWASDGWSATRAGNHALSRRRCCGFVCLSHTRR